MIVKMKKVTILVSQKHLNNALGHLRGLGLMHIKHMREPSADALTSCEHKLQLLNRALSLLDISATPRGDLDKDQISFYVKEIIILDRKRHELEAKLKELEDKYIRHKQWGGIWAHPLAELKKSGVFIKLYLGTKKDLKYLSKETLIYTVGRSRGKIYLAAFFNNQEDSLNLEEVEVPLESLHSLQKKTVTIQRELEEVSEELAKASGYKGRFIECKEEILKRREFYSVRFGMVHEEDICCLRGFCPQEGVSKITKVADEQGWATIVQEPKDEEEVPTLIRTPRWVEIIQPVFKFMGTIPGYKEYDISFWFLLFFSLFLCCCLFLFFC